MVLNRSDITDLVLVGVEGAVGRIHLNRPQALNSLNTDMCLAVCQALIDWETQDEVQTIVITGEGRGLCAGGDVVAVREHRIAGEPESFFKVEYGMIKLIASYAKPVVAIMHGIVMGGGLGISAHASHRVVTETTKTAMPEGRIGFWCDVGMTWPLATRSPGKTGFAFAMTGAIGSPAQTIGLHLADTLIPDNQIPTVIARLEAGEHPDTVLDEMGTVPDTTDVRAAQAWIDPCFDAPDPATILERLRARPEQEAQDAADAMAEYSPLSMHVILCALQLAAGAPSLAAVLDADLAIATHFAQADSDFDEGVRAQLVDKDKNPRWMHTDLASVPPDLVSGFFANTY
ncbi:3-hydroxyisobutyryl-CoA hydrolase [Stomatohabitans albus]|uniref:3-hydroxyisobutyryl-CoA hydrolase n=1 Tax=Stomatohabitans albus TaxID=3110766 RepID=UPI00300D50CB